MNAVNAMALYEKQQGRELDAVEQHVFRAAYAMGVMDHQSENAAHIGNVQDGAKQIHEAAELACGLLWMVEDRREKVREAFHALCDALGGSGSKGLGKAIQRAIDAGHEADHPPGCDWWAGKKTADEEEAEFAEAERQIQTGGF
jgi:hypothetical protein